MENGLEASDLLAAQDTAVVGDGHLAGFLRDDDGHGIADLTDAQRRAALDNHTERLAELELQRRQQGGERIEELDREQGRAEAERDMEPHKRDGYFEMMCDMADYQRKWIRENGK